MVHIFIPENFNLSLELNLALEAVYLRFPPKN